MANWDIHDYPKLIALQQKRLRGLPCHCENKRLILAFDRACITEGLGIARRSKILQTLVDIARRYLTTRFATATKQDIHDAVARIQSAPLSPYTTREYKVILRKFFKWVVFREDALSRDDFPDIVAWVKTTLKRKDVAHLRASDLLTPAEATRLVQTAETPRNKAFLGLLWELGVRIGEAGTLRIGDVSRDEYGFMVDVAGKTGRRSVRLIEHASHLVSWLNAHPDKENPAAPLWPVSKPRLPVRAARYHAMKNWITRAAKEAGIRKRVFPHLFRYSRATYLVASGALTEQQAKKFFGWTPDSKMLSTYVHLVDKDANDAILRMYGIQPQDDPSTQPQARQCGMCHATNPSGSRFCYGCGCALDVTAPAEAQAREKRAEDVLAQFLRKPQVRELFKRMVQEMNIDGIDNVPPREAPPPGRPTGALDTDASHANTPRSPSHADDARRVRKTSPNDDGFQS